MSSIAENIAFVKENVQKARQDSAYAAANITIMAVTKTVTPERMHEAQIAGLTVFGENKVQELVDKFPLFHGITWHMIGHLQMNKVKYITDKVVMFHSLDRLSLAVEIEKQAAKIDRIIPCLLEVNVAAEESKFGLRQDEVLDFARALVAYPHIQVRGLMTIAPPVENMEENRPIFGRLRELKEEVAALGLPHLQMTELSMGMSGDFPVAVAEGATIIRVGSRIFGQRVYR